MRIIIAGSRKCSRQDVFKALACCPWVNFISAVVSGTARGADEFGEVWAVEKGVDIIQFPADWSKYGKRAGPIRNKQMAENADGLIAVWDGLSRGTKSMIDFAIEKGLRVYIFRTNEDVTFNIPPKGEIAALWELAEERAAIKEYSSNIEREIAEHEAGVEIRKMHIMVSEEASLPPNVQKQK